MMGRVDQPVALFCAGLSDCVRAGSYRCLLWTPVVVVAEAVFLLHFFKVSHQPLVSSSIPKLISNIWMVRHIRLEIFTSHFLQPLHDVAHCDKAWMKLKLETIFGGDK